MTKILKAFFFFKKIQNKLFGILSKSVNRLHFRILINVIHNLNSDNMKIQNEPTFVIYFKNWKNRLR